MNPAKTKWVHILFLNSTSKAPNHTPNAYALKISTFWMYIIFGQENENNIRNKMSPQII